MAYRYEKNENGERDLVIDGWENGIADSPFEGIGNIRNLNVRYYKGVAYVNYKRKACTITGGTMGVPAYATQSPAGIIYISDTSGQIFKQTAVNGSTFALLSGGPAGTGGYGLQFWNNDLISWRITAIDICGDGTGDIGVLSSNWNTATGASGVLPIATATITATASISAGDTSTTMTGYVDAQGTTRAFWNGPTGSYTTLLGGLTGQSVIANLTQGSSTISWFPQATFSAAATLIVNPVSSLSQHMSLTSINDGNCYFCNGSNVGSINLLPNQVFKKTNMSGQNWVFNSASLGLPPTEQTVWLTELRNQLLAGTFFKIYPWDRISTSWSNPIPLGEKLSKMINILNNVYILAGNKGNIYISNGYNAQRFKKLPDNIAGVIDPSWSFGGIMTHRQNLNFQALATNSQTGVPILAGIFSLNLDDETLSMDAQNSYGLASSGSTGSGLLIDNNSIDLSYDNYYSAFASSTSTGGIDFNDTTLWSGSEPLIETDMIPIGTFAQSRTFTSSEFKLDQPLKSGDSISLYARQSQSDSYTLLGTTTDAVLSDFYQPADFEKWQWIQFKVVFNCNATSTSSSFTRLREIRIR